MRHKVIIFAALFVLAFAACRHSPDAQTNRPEAKKFSAADIAKLRWIEGTWRGSGVDQAPFFERYRFENESTLAVDSFPDEKLDKVDDTTRFELKDGTFGNPSRSEEHTSEPSHLVISYAVFCLKKKKNKTLA